MLTGLVMAPLGALGVVAPPAGAPPAARHIAPTAVPLVAAARPLPTPPGTPPLPAPAARRPPPRRPRPPPRPAAPGRSPAGARPPAGPNTPATDSSKPSCVTVPPGGPPRGIPPTPNPRPDRNTTALVIVDLGPANA